MALPVNNGKGWDRDEDEQLLVLAGSHMSMKDIADTHERTEGSIRARLRIHARLMHNAGKSIEEIVGATGLPMRSILDALRFAYKIPKGLSSTSLSTPTTQTKGLFKSKKETLYAKINNLESRIEKLEKHIASLQ